MLTKNIGGAFTWDTSLDDFSGQFCNEGTFPLIRTAIDTLNNNVSPTVAPTVATTTAGVVLCANQNTCLNQGGRAFDSLSI